MFCSVMLSGCSIAAPQVEVNYSDGIYHIVVPQSKAKKKVKVYASTSLKTNEEIHKLSKKINKSWIELAQLEDEIEDKRFELINKLKSE